MFHKSAALIFTLLVVSAQGFSTAAGNEKSLLHDISKDTTRTGGSGAENVPRLLPAYKTKTPSTDGNYDDEYEVPHVVNTTGSTSGGRGGISAAYGGRSGRGDLGTRKMLRERGVMGGIRDPAEERLGRGGSKQVLFPRDDNLVSRQRREGANGSHSKDDNDDNGNKNDDQEDDGDYDDFEDEDGDLSHKQGRNGMRPRQGASGSRSFPGRRPQGRHAGCYWWAVYPRPPQGGDGDGGDDGGGDDYDYDYSRYSRRRRNRKTQRQRMRRRKKKTIIEDGQTQKASNSQSASSKQT